MTESIGKVGIEVSVDNGKLDAGIADAKRSIRSFGQALESNIGTATGKASRSIDNYVRNLQTAAATQGKSARETELYKLALRGASAEQLSAANSALKLAEGYQRGQELGSQLRVGFLALAAAATAAAVGAAAGTVALINQVAKYQDLSEKIGDTAVNISSLKTASDVTGTSLDTVANASVRLTATLSKTDDESKSAGQAIKALGLDFATFKAQSPVEQLQAVAGALEGFADGSEKSAVAVALFGKSGADLLGFLKEYGSEGLNAAYVTGEQVKAADDFGDSIAKLRSQFGQFLEVQAVSAIPVLQDIGNLFATISKEQDATSAASGVLKSAISGLVTVLQIIAGVGSDIVFVFQGVGREIGAIAAQAVALARLDFKSFRAISVAVTEDAARARAQLDKFQAQLFAIGKSQTIATAAQPAAPAKPRLNTSGLVTGNKPSSGRADNTAAQEAKAQLGFDLDAIRKDTEALSNTISNREKLLEAERGAALTSEAAYYAQKRVLIQDNNALQVESAKREIERLQAEKLSGKDKIDNDRKIADAQAKLTLLRDNGAASLQVLAIQENASLASISRAYQDARDAAQSYFDQTQRARQSEIAGFGQGNLARGREAGLNQIREKFEQQRQELQRANRDGKFIGRADDYERELALIQEFQSKELNAYTNQYQKLDSIRGSYELGAREGLQNYYDEASDIYGQTERLISNSFQGAEDALVDFVTTGKLSFSSLANSILNDLARIAVQQSITKPLSEFLFNSGGSSGGGGSALLNAAVSFFGGGKASGGPVNPGKFYEVNERGPELLNVAGRQYLMMGSQGGNVTPNSAVGGSKTVNVTVNQTFGPNTSRATTMQAAADARRQLESAARNT